MAHQDQQIHLPTPNKTTLSKPQPPKPKQPKQLGPLRAVEGTAEIAGCLSAAGLVGILALCLSLYGAAQFQSAAPKVGVKTLSGRSVQRDALQSADGWSGFTAGWLVGGLSGVAWAYVCTQILPYYS
jgi:photosystem I subunit 11